MKDTEEAISQSKNADVSPPESLIYQIRYRLY